jgi:broad specificity phosphatase PhoE
VERALLIRHAESERSVLGLTNGDPSVHVGLSPAGLGQAEALRELLEVEPIDLCVTSEFARTRETADLALTGREIPRLVLAGLNDIRFGEFEGRPLADYRAWARGHGPTDPAPGRGESRVETVRRYVESFRTILDRPEAALVVVAHSLPIRYLLDAVAGELPRPAVAQVEYAVPNGVSKAELTGATDLLEAWTLAPSWPG